MKHRQLRLNEVVKRELSAIIARQINFEGVLVSINSVDVTPDLKNAHVFVSILGAATGASVIDKLEAHRPLLQAELSRHVVLKESRKTQWHGRVNAVATALRAVYRSESFRFFPTTHRAVATR